MDNGRRTRRWAGVGITLSAAVATVALVAARQTSIGSVNVGNSAPVAAMAADVPWVDRPNPPMADFRTATTLPPVDARPCGARDVSVAANGGNGGGGRVESYFLFRNISSTTCLLSGRPDTVGVEADGTRISPDPWLGGPPPANIAPGESALLIVGDVNTCNRAGDDPPGLPTVVSVLVHLGGGDIELPSSPILACGFSLSEFGVIPPESQSQSPPDPRWQLRARLELPATVQRGAMLSYVIAITNPTAQDISMEPCPGYIQASAAVRSLKSVYGLNCDTVRDIAAGRTVRYAMQAKIPTDAPTGAADIGWDLTIPSAPSSTGMLATGTFIIS